MGGFSTLKHWHMYIASLYYYPVLREHGKNVDAAPPLPPLGELVCVCVYVCRAVDWLYDEIRCKRTCCFSHDG